MRAKITVSVEEPGANPQEVIWKCLEEFDELYSAINFLVNHKREHGGIHILRWSGDYTSAVLTGLNPNASQ